MKSKKKIESASANAPKRLGYIVDKRAPGQCRNKTIAFQEFTKHNFAVWSIEPAQ